VFTVRVTNVGGSDALNAALVDQVPAIFQVVGVTTSRGTCAAVVSNTVNCQFGTLRPAEFVDVTYTFTVAPNAALGQVINTACASTTTNEQETVLNCDTATTEVICRVDNVITKTDNVTTVIAGSPNVYTFTITVTNNGPSTSRNTVLTDTWPSQYTVVTNPTPSQGSCALTGAGFECNLGTLNPAATATVTISYRVRADVLPATSVTNQVCVANSCVESNPGNNCAVDVNNIATSADLTVAKDDCIEECVVAGNPVPYTYTMIATNNGPSDAVSVVLTDTWPSQYIPGTFSFNGRPGQCNLSQTGFVCTWDRLAAGESVTVFITYSIDEDTLPGFATNCVRVASATPDPNSLNNEACDTNQICDLADVAVTKTIDSEDCITAGSGVPRAFTVTVTNNGPSRARNVVLTEKWPAGLTLIQLAPGCSLVPGTSNYTCPLGDLARGASVTKVFLFTVPASTPSGRFENFVNVQATTPDPDLCNNNATVCGFICVESDLAVTKTDNQRVVTAGDGVVYTYVVVTTNFGPSDARNVVITDVWPAGFVRGSIDAPGANCSTTSDGFQCRVAYLAVGASYTIRVNYTVDACTTACEVCNVVTVTSDSVDRNDRNNVATDCTEIRTEADLEVCKSDGVNWVTAGDGITYTYNITVTNYGPSCAENVRLVDHFPKEVLQVADSITTSKGSCVRIANSNDFSCNLQTLLPGETVWIAVSYRVPSTAETCSVVNVATVSSVTFDPKLCNNDAKDVNALIEKARLTISKTDNLETLTQNDVTPHTYVIRVTNTGPSTARDVVVTDRWPYELAQFLNSIVAPNGTTCVSTGFDFSCTLGDVAVGQEVVITVRYTLAPDAPVGAVINRVSAFSPTDEECRDAQDSTLVLAGPTTTRTLPPTTTTVTHNIVACEACFVTAAAGACSAQYTACTTEACASCVANPFNDVGLPNPLCFTPDACPLTKCIIDQACSAQCRSPGQPDITCSGASGADLFITKSGSSPVCVGATSAFTLRITNQGASTATNVVVSDLFPSQLIIGALPAACARSGQSVVCQPGNIAPGATVVLALPYSSNTPGTYVNLAQVSSQNEVPVNNNQDTAEVSIVQCNPNKRSLVPTPVILAPKEIELVATRAASGRIQIKLTNVQDARVTVEKLVVDIELANGKSVSVDLTSKSFIVPETTCGVARSREMGPKWTVTCEVQLALPAGAKAVGISVNGSSPAKEGKHPIIGVKKL
jgi:uncharacterized repeat protein (TIGR01451 family)